jgi:hypothetical protein
MTDFRAVLETLVGGGVRFIVIGGAAAVAHGTARLTQDIEVIYARDRENIERTSSASRLLLRPTTRTCAGRRPGFRSSSTRRRLRAG